MTVSEQIVQLMHDGNFPEVARLLADNLTEFYFSDPSRLGDIVQALPESALAEHPVLRMAMSFATPLPEMPSRGFTARLALPMSFDFESLSEDEKDWYLMGLLVMHRMRGEYAEAHDVATRVRPRLRRADLPRSRAMRQILPSYFTQIGSAEMLGGHLQQAREDFEEATSVDAPVESSSFLRDARVRLSLLHAAEGNLRRAEQLLDEAAAYPLRDDSYAPRVRDRERLAQLLISVERGDEDAVAALNAQRNPRQDELWPLRLLADARWADARGNPAGVLTQIEHATRTHPIPEGSLGDQVVKRVLIDARASLGASGRSHVSSTEAQQLRKDAEGTGAVRFLVHLEDAPTALGRARAMATLTGLGPSTRAETLLVIDWATRLATGEPDPAAARAASGLILEEGLWRVLALFPLEVREACLAWMGADAASAPRWIADARVADVLPTVVLTRRERAVLQRLALSGSLAEIAGELHVSVNTVKTQLRSLYRRLGVANRADAVREGARRGLIAEIADDGRSSPPLPASAWGAATERSARLDKRRRAEVPPRG